MLQLTFIYQLKKESYYVSVRHQRQHMGPTSQWLKGVGTRWTRSTRARAMHQMVHMRRRCGTAVAAIDSHIAQGPMIWPPPDTT